MSLPDAPLAILDETVYPEVFQSQKLNISKSSPAKLLGLAKGLCSNSRSSDSGKSSSCSPILLDCSFDSGIAGLLLDGNDMQLRKRIQQCQCILLALERDQEYFLSIRNRLSKITNRKQKQTNEKELFCNVCCAEIDARDEKTYVTCCICKKYICRNTKCSDWLQKTAEWECELCQTSKESLAQTSSWVADQITFNQEKLICPARARSEIYIPISEYNDSLMHFESVSQVGANSNTITAEQKFKIREYVEEVVAKLLGGNLDTIAVNQLSKSENYLPDPQPKLLQNGTSQNSVSVRANGHDFSNISETRLRQMIEKIIAETMSLPPLSSGHAVSEIALDRPSRRASDNKALTNNGYYQRHRTEHYFEPTIYQDLLATAVLNKIVGKQLNSNQEIPERNIGDGEVNDNIRLVSSDQNFNAEKLSTSSGSSVEPRSDCSYPEIDQTHNNNDDKSSELPPNSDRESVMSDYLANHMIPLPDLNAITTESEEDDYTSVTSSAVGDGTWEKNWLFKKKKSALTTSVTSSSIGMLVPDPKEDIRAQIGDKTADEVSDLSELGSDSDDSLNSLRSQLEPINDRLINKHLIGGQNSKIILDELIECSSMISNTLPTDTEPLYTDACNENIIDATTTTKTEAINDNLNQQQSTNEPNATACPVVLEEINSNSLTATDDNSNFDGCTGFSAVEIIESTAHAPSVVEILAAMALAPMLAVPSIDQPVTVNVSELNAFTELKELALAEIKARALELTPRNLDVIPEESADVISQTEIISNSNKILRTSSYSSEELILTTQSSLLPELTESEDKTTQEAYSLLPESGQCLPSKGITGEAFESHQHPILPNTRVEETTSNEDIAKSLCEGAKSISHKSNSDIGENNLTESNIKSMKSCGNERKPHDDSINDKESSKTAEITSQYQYSYIYSDVVYEEQTCDLNQQEISVPSNIQNDEVLQTKNDSNKHFNNLNEKICSKEQSLEVHSERDEENTKAELSNNEQQEFSCLLSLESTSRKKVEQITEDLDECSALAKDNAGHKLENSINDQPSEIEKLFNKESAAGNLATNLQHQLEELPKVITKAVSKENSLEIINKQIENVLIDHLLKETILENQPRSSDEVMIKEQSFDKEAEKSNVCADKQTNSTNNVLECEECTLNEQAKGTEAIISKEKSLNNSTEEIEKVSQVKLDSTTNSDKPIENILEEIITNQIQAKQSQTLSGEQKTPTNNISESEICTLEEHLRGTEEALSKPQTFNTQTEQSEKVFILQSECTNQESKTNECTLNEQSGVIEEKIAEESTLEQIEKVSDKILDSTTSSPKFRDIILLETQPRSLDEITTKEQTFETSAFICDEQITFKNNALQSTDCKLKEPADAIEARTSKEQSVKIFNEQIEKTSNEQLYFTTSSSKSMESILEKQQAVLDDISMNKQPFEIAGKKSGILHAEQKDSTNNKLKSEIYTLEEYSREITEEVSTKPQTFYIPTEKSALLSDTQTTSATQESKSEQIANISSARLDSTHTLAETSDKILKRGPKSLDELINKDRLFEQSEMYSDKQTNHTNNSLEFQVHRKSIEAIISKEQSLQISNEEIEIDSNDQLDSNTSSAKSKESSIEKQLERLEATITKAPSMETHAEQTDSELRTNIANDTPNSAEHIPKKHSGDVETFISKNQSLEAQPNQTETFSDKQTGLTNNELLKQYPLGTEDENSKNIQMEQYEIVYENQSESEEFSLNKQFSGIQEEICKETLFEIRNEDIVKVSKEQLDSTTTKSNDIALEKQPQCLEEITTNEQSFATQTQPSEIFSEQQSSLINDALRVVVEVHPRRMEEEKTPKEENFNIPNQKSEILSDTQTESNNNEIESKDCMVNEQASEVGKEIAKEDTVEKPHKQIQKVSNKSIDSPTSLAESKEGILVKQPADLDEVITNEQCLETHDKESETIAYEKVEEHAANAPKPEMYILDEQLQGIEKEIPKALTFDIPRQQSENPSDIQSEKENSLEILNETASNEQLESTNSSAKSDYCTKANLLNNRDEIIIKEQHHETQTEQNEMVSGIESDSSTNTTKPEEGSLEEQSSETGAAVSKTQPSHIPNEQIEKDLNDNLNTTKGVANTIECISGNQPRESDETISKDGDFEQQLEQTESGSNSQSDSINNVPNPKKYIMEEIASEIEEVIAKDQPLKIPNEQNETASSNQLYSTTGVTKSKDCTPSVPHEIIPKEQTLETQTKENETISYFVPEDQPRGTEQVTFREQPLEITLIEDETVSNEQSHSTNNTAKSNECILEEQSNEIALTVFKKQSTEISNQQSKTVPNEQLQTTNSAALQRVLSLEDQSTACEELGLTDNAAESKKCSIVFDEISSKEQTFKIKVEQNETISDCILEDESAVTEPQTFNTQSEKIEIVVNIQLNTNNNVVCTLDNQAVEFDEVISKELLFETQAKQSEIISNEQSISAESKKQTLQKQPTGFDEMSSKERSLTTRVEQNETTEGKQSEFTNIASKSKECTLTERSSGFKEEISQQNYLDMLDEQSILNSNRQLISPNSSERQTTFDEEIMLKEKSTEHNYQKILNSSKEHPPKTSTEELNTYSNAPVTQLSICENTDHSASLNEEDLKADNKTLEERLTEANEITSEEIPSEASSAGLNTVSNEHVSQMSICDNSDSSTSMTDEDVSGDNKTWEETSTKSNQITSKEHSSATPSEELKAVANKQINQLSNCDNFNSSSSMTDEDLKSINKTLEETLKESNKITSKKHSTETSSEELNAVTKGQVTQLRICDIHDSSTSIIDKDLESDNKTQEKISTVSNEEIPTEYPYEPPHEEVKTASNEQITQLRICDNSHSTIGMIDEDLKFDNNTLEERLTEPNDIISKEHPSEASSEKLNTVSHENLTQLSICDNSDSTTIRTDENLKSDSKTLGERSTESIEITSKEHTSEALSEEFNTASNEDVTQLGICDNSDSSSSMIDEDFKYSSTNMTGEDVNGDNKILEEKSADSNEIISKELPSETSSEELNTVSNEHVTQLGIRDNSDFSTSMIDKDLESDNKTEEKISTVSNEVTPKKYPSKTTPEELNTVSNEQVIQLGICDNSDSATSMIDEDFKHFSASMIDEDVNVDNKTLEEISTESNEIISKEHTYAAPTEELNTQLSICDNSESLSRMLPEDLKSDNKTLKETSNESNKITSKEHQFKTLREEVNIVSNEQATQPSVSDNFDSSTNMTDVCLKLDNKILEEKSMESNEITSKEHSPEIPPEELSTVCNEKVTQPKTSANADSSTRMTDEDMKANNKILEEKSLDSNKINFKEQPLETQQELITSPSSTSTIDEDFKVDNKTEEKSTESKVITTKESRSETPPHQLNAIFNETITQPVICDNLDSSTSMIDEDLKSDSNTLEERSSAVNEITSKEHPSEASSQELNTVSKEDITQLSTCDNSDSATSITNENLKSDNKTLEKISLEANEIISQEHPSDASTEELNIPSNEYVNQLGSCHNLDTSTSMIDEDLQSDNQTRDSKYFPANMTDEDVNADNKTLEEALTEFKEHSSATPSQELKTVINVQISQLSICDNSDTSDNMIDDLKCNNKPLEETSKVPNEIVSKEHPFKTSREELNIVANEEVTPLIICDILDSSTSVIDKYLESDNRTPKDRSSKIPPEELNTVSNEQVTKVGVFDNSYSSTIMIDEDLKSDINTEEKILTVYDEVTVKQHPYETLHKEVNTVCSEPGTQLSICDNSDSLSNMIDEDSKFEKTFEERSTEANEKTSKLRPSETPLELNTVCNEQVAQLSICDNSDASNTTTDESLEFDNKTELAGSNEVTPKEDPCAILHEELNLVSNSQLTQQSICDNSISSSSMIDEDLKSNNKILEERSMESNDIVSKECLSEISHEELNTVSSSTCMINEDLKSNNTTEITTECMEENNSVTNEQVTQLSICDNSASLSSMIDEHLKSDSKTLEEISLEANEITSQEHSSEISPEELITVSKEQPTQLSVSDHLDSSTSMINVDLKSDNKTLEEGSMVSNKISSKEHPFETPPDELNTVSSSTSMIDEDLKPNNKTEETTTECIEELNAVPNEQVSQLSICDSSDYLSSMINEDLKSSNMTLEEISTKYNEKTSVVTQSKDIKTIEYEQSLEPNIYDFTSNKELLYETETDETKTISTEDLVALKNSPYKKSKTEYIDSDERLAVPMEISTSHTIGLDGSMETNFLPESETNLTPALECENTTVTMDAQDVVSKHSTFDIFVDENSLECTPVVTRQSTVVEIANNSNRAGDNLPPGNINISKKLQRQCRIVDTTPSLEDVSPLSDPQTTSPNKSLADLCQKFINDKHLLTALENRRRQTLLMHRFLNIIDLSHSENESVEETLVDCESLTHSFNHSSDHDDCSESFILQINESNNISYNFINNILFSDQLSYDSNPTDGSRTGTFEEYIESDVDEKDILAISLNNKSSTNDILNANTNTASETNSTKTCICKNSVTNIPSTPSNRRRQPDNLLASAVQNKDTPRSLLGDPINNGQTEIKIFRDGKYYSNTRIDIDVGANNNGDGLNNNDEGDDGDDDDDIVTIFRHFVPGSIAEREYKKWYNAVEMPNNPYAPEALKRRISGSQERFIDLPNISPAKDLNPLDLLNKPNMDADENVKIENDYKRYSRDYYINSGLTTPQTSPARDVSPTIAEDKRETKRSKEANEIDLYKAIPAQVIEGNSFDMETLQPKSTSDDSDTIKLIDSVKKRNTSATINDTSVKQREKGTIDQRETEEKASHLSATRSESAGSLTASTRGSTPVAFKFLQPKRKLLEPNQVLTADEEGPQVTSNLLEKPVIEAEVVKALPSVKALARAFLMTTNTSQPEKLWIRKARTLSQGKKRPASPQRSLDLHVRTERIKPDDDLTITSDLSSLETDSSSVGTTAIQTTSDLIPPTVNDPYSPSSEGDTSPVPVRHGVLKNNIAFFENLKNK